MRLGRKNDHKMSGMKITGVVRDPSNAKIVGKEEDLKCLRKVMEKSEEQCVMADKRHDQEGQILSKVRAA